VSAILLGLASLFSSDELSRQLRSRGTKADNAGSVKKDCLAVGLF